MKSVPYDTYTYNSICMYIIVVDTRSHCYNFFMCGESEINTPMRCLRMMY